MKRSPWYEEMTQLKTNERNFASWSTSTKILLLLLLLSPLVIRMGYTCSVIPGFKPIYMPYEELRASINSLPPESVQQAGKIVVQGSRLFISDTDRGIHIIDNSNPSAPQALAFVQVPGNKDLVVVDNILYADSYVDLVAIDITAPLAAFEIERLEHVYPNNPFGLEDFYWSEPVDDTQGVVIDREEASSGGGCGESNESSGGGCSPFSYGGGGSSSSSESAQNLSSVSGSLARMVLSDNNIYLLFASLLKVIDLKTPESPALVSTMEIAWDVETIYPYNGNLFIGGQTGVRILSLDNPNFPALIGTYNHDWQCDPIVVQGDVAYVTLRGGWTCWGGESSLDLLDVSDLTQPSLFFSYPLENPFGLAIDGDVLFVADGTAGLKVFEVSDSQSLSKINQVPDRSVHDIIAINNVAVVIGEQGVAQYDYSDPENLIELSYFEF